MNYRYTLSGSIYFTEPESEELIKNFFEKDAQSDYELEFHYTDHNVEDLRTGEIISQLNFVTIQPVSIGLWVADLQALVNLIPDISAVDIEQQGEEPDDLVHYRLAKLTHADLYTNIAKYRISPLPDEGAHSAKALHDLVHIPEIKLTIEQASDPHTEDIQQYIVMAAPATVRFENYEPYVWDE